MNGKHKLSLDNIFGRTEALGVLDDGVAVGVGVDEIGYVGDFALKELAVGAALAGNERKLHLFAEIADNAAALHRLEQAGAAVLAMGVVTGNLLGAEFGRFRDFSVHHCI